nr:hypothetical protein LRH_14071 [Lacticaseibacillus rhamnosus HN001]
MGQSDLKMLTDILFVGIFFAFFQNLKLMSAVFVA